MAATLKQLGQTRPADTNNHSLYSPGAGVATVVLEIVVCNTTGTAATFRIFNDDNGSTYDQTTALYYDVSIAANTTIQITCKLGMNDSTGNLAVRSGTASAITFTAHGTEIT